MVNPANQENLALRKQLLVGVEETLDHQIIFILVQLVGVVVVDQPMNQTAPSGVLAVDAKDLQEVAGVEVEVKVKHMNLHMGMEVVAIMVVLVAAVVVEAMLEMQVELEEQLLLVVLEVLVAPVGQLILQLVQQFQLFLAVPVQLQLIQEVK